MANVQSAGISALVLLSLSALTSLFTIGKLVGYDVGWDKPLLSFFSMTMIFTAMIILEPDLDSWN